MSRRSLHSARVLLTGASSGIGRELALALARRGARLLLTARRTELLEALAAECVQVGAAADYLSGDVTDPARRAGLIARARGLWDGLDVLINNAGISAHGRFDESDEPTLRAIMELNFFAATELTRIALPLLNSVTPRSPEGPAQHLKSSPNPKSKIQNPKLLPPAIVNIGSIIGHRGLPLNSEYAASKFALRGWTESLRAELAADGIDVLLVSPGSTATEFFDHLLARRSRLPWSGSKTISPAAVAEQIVRALERGQREIFPNWRGRVMVLANRLFPGLVDRAMTRVLSAKSPLGGEPKRPGNEDAGRL
jgi:short-subunit dehydrogenase